MQNKLTIVIPTHYRHKYLSRILEYYKNVEYTVLIADSSAEKYTGDLMPHMDYFHYPDGELNQKILSIVSKVETEYMFFCADDDFWVKESIPKCIHFLDENQDYSSVQGRYIGFTCENKITFVPSYLHAESIEDSQITQRLNASMSNYMPLFYSMHRTDIIQKVFSDNFKTGINHAILNELSVALYSLIYGKHKVIDLLTYVRDDESLPTPVDRDNLRDIATKEKFKKEFEQFKNNVSSIIVNADQQLNAPEIVSAALSKYISKINVSKKQPNKIKVLLKRYLYFFKPIYAYIAQKKSIKTIFKATSHLHGYPHVDQQSKKSWDTIYNLIKVHNVKG